MFSGELNIIPFMRLKIEPNILRGWDGNKAIPNLIEEDCPHNWSHPIFID